MDFVEMKLQDAISKEEYILKLSPSDAMKAQNDMAFATILLNYARQNKNQNEPANILTLPCATNNSSANETLDIEMDIAPAYTSTDAEENAVEAEELPDNFRWSHEAVLLLIEQYRQWEQDMRNGKISHKKAWDGIAAAMNAKGYMVTSRQCTTRVNTMKRTYKAVKDHNAKSGNNKRPWKYFDLMESLLGEKPYMAPLSTISSTGAATSKPRSGSTSSTASSSGTCNNETSEDNVMQMGKCRKRKAPEVAQAILESRKTAEEKKDKRHKERMEVKEKLLEKLDKILEKL